MVAQGIALRTRWYEESPGVTSGKRVFGGFVLSTGWAMKISLFFLAVFGHVNDPATANAQADSLVYAGAGLLGITFMENTFGKEGVN